MLWKRFVCPNSTVIYHRWNNSTIASPIQPSALRYFWAASSQHSVRYNRRHRPYRWPAIVLMRSDSGRYVQHDVPSSRNPSTSSAAFPRAIESALPSKEQLFHVDSLTDKLRQTLSIEQTLAQTCNEIEFIPSGESVPKFLSNRKDFVEFMKLCTKDIVFDDSIFKRHTEGIDEFIRHVSLSQLYFSLMRAASRFEKIGSCIYENSDVVVVLWRLTAIRLYQQNKEIAEGALDIHLNENGKIYKISNRPITRDDREHAAALRILKAEAVKIDSGEGQR